MPAYFKSVQVQGVDARELYIICEREIEKLLPQATFGKVSLSKFPDKNELYVKSGMFEATLQCEDGKMTLNGKLGFIALPFKSVIDQTIEKWIAKQFKKI